MLVLSCIAEVIKLNLRFERCSSKMKCCKNTDFFSSIYKSNFCRLLEPGKGSGWWGLSALRCHLGLPPSSPFACLISGILKDAAGNAFPAKKGVPGVAPGHSDNLI